MKRVSTVEKCPAMGADSEGLIAPDSRRRLGLRRLEWAAASPQALAELLALLGCHFLPALVHALPNTLVYSSPHIGARRAMTTPSAEEDAAQRQKSKGLPEGDLAPAEQRRQQPIPKVQHYFAANGNKYRDRQNRQRGNENPFLSHVQFLMLSYIRRKHFAIVRGYDASRSACARAAYSRSRQSPRPSPCSCDHPVRERRKLHAARQGVRQAQTPAHPEPRC